MNHDANFKTLIKGWNLNFFENSARNKSPTYLHMWHFSLYGHLGNAIYIAMDPFLYTVGL